MRGAAIGLALVAGGALVVGCGVSVEAPDDVIVACTSDDECPAGWVCDLTDGLCFSSTSNGAPRLAVETPTPDGLRDVTRVNLAFTLDDRNAGREGGESVSVVFEYTLDEPEAEEAEWLAATPHADSDAIVDITSLASDRTWFFVWDALADAELHGALDTVTIDADSDGNPEREVLAFHERVTLRGTPTDAAGLSGAVEVSDSFALGDDPQGLTLETLDPVVSDILVIYVTLSDAAYDAAQLQVEFSTDGGALWRRARPAFGSTSDLASHPDGRLHVFVWDTLATPDPDPSAQQGVGELTHHDVLLRARAVDGPFEGALHYSPWTAAPEPFTIRNQTPPRIAELSAPRAEIAGGSGPVLLTYRLVDEQSDPGDIYFEYSFDAGNTWAPCVEYHSPFNEGRHALASAPDDDEGQGGISHLFFWDPTDLRITPAVGAQLRATVSDGRNFATDGAPLVGSELLALAHPVGPLASPYYPPARIDVASPPVGLLLADFDRDGLPDIAVLERSAGRISLWRATGSTNELNAFEALGQQSPTAGPLYAAASGDLNGDGHPDVIAGSATDDLHVLLNDGTGLLAATIDPFPALAADATVRALLIADFDGDDLADLVAGLQGNDLDGFILYAGNGDGTFTYREGWLLTSGSAPTPVISLAAADFDRDGDLDLAAGTATRAWYSLLFRAENVSDDPLAPDLFSFPSQAADGIPDNVLDIELTDLNGDGDLDLCALHGGWYGDPDQTAFAAGVTVMLGSGTMAFADQGFFYWPDLSAIASADVDGDGATDLVATAADAGEALVFRGGNDGLAGLSTAPEPFAVGGGPAALITGDVNLDGRLDLVVATETSQQITVLLSRQNLEHSPFGSPVASGNLTDCRPLAAADLDWDGQADVVCAGQGGDPSVTIYHGRPGGERFTAGQQLAANASVAVVVDLDGDEAPDIVTIDAEAGSLVVFYGTRDHGVANGEVGRSSSYPIPGAAHLAAADLTRDGHRDILLFSETGAHLFAGGSIDLPVPTPIIGPDCCLVPAPGAVADFDGDGLLDVVWESPASVGEVALYRGEASDPGYAFAPAALALIEPSGGAEVDDLVAADFNADGLLDLAVSWSDASSGGFSILLAEGSAGIGQGTFAAPLPTLFGGPSSLTAEDFDGDGIVDLLVRSHGLARSVLHLGNGVAGQGDGTFRPAQDYDGDRLLAVVADFDRDAILDAVGDALSFSAGRRDGLGESWRVPISEWWAGAGSGTLLVGVGPLVGNVDLLGAPYAPATVTQHRAQVATVIGELRREQPEMIAGQVPLTHPWQLLGDLRLKQTDDPSGDEQRFLVAHRFGDKVAGSHPTVRGGLDLSPTDGSGESGIIIELPVLAGRSVGAGDSITLLHRAESFVRAAELTDDPIFGSPEATAFLPRLPTDAGYRHVIHARSEWRVIPADADDDLNTGSGPRFVVAYSDEGLMVRALTDHLGLFQAFAGPP